MKPLRALVLADFLILINVWSNNNKIILYVLLKSNSVSTERVLVNNLKFKIIIDFLTLNNNNNNNGMVF